MYVEQTFSQKNNMLVDTLDIIKKVNETLREYKVKDESNILFMWAHNFLRPLGLYKGFDYCKDDYREGKCAAVYVDDPEESEYIQLVE